MNGPLQHPWFGRLALLATALALCVVVLGAYVRLSDAGLGCPDWPGCYGRLAVPEAPEHVAEAERAFPDRPVVPAKAWKEMVHRYFASTLGLLIVIMAIIAVRNRRQRPEQPLSLPLFLVVLVVFQGLMGMWTVTLLLKPLIVMGHLLGGMATLSLLWWTWLRERGPMMPAAAAGPGLRTWAVVALVLVALQIALGGWTSSNYAALACTEFPTCHGGQWWPHMNFREAFVLWRGIGVNYEYGVLEHPARAAIHMTHRIGALVVALAVGGLALRLLRSRAAQLRRTGMLLAAVLVLQIGLGIANVLLSLPLPVAVAHNAGAALLLLTVVLLNHQLRPVPHAARDTVRRDRSALTSGQPIRG